jgi:hypothetical protein
VVWLRTLIVHPLALVAPAVALSSVLARGKDSTATSDVWVMLYVLALAPILSTVLTLAMLRSKRMSRHQKANFVVLGFGAGIGAAVLGAVLWWDAVGIACDGRYECPL